MRILGRHMRLTAVFATGAPARAHCRDVTGVPLVTNANDGCWQRWASSRPAADRVKRAGAAPSRPEP
jgi:hypothetical protein